MSVKKKALSQKYIHSKKKPKWLSHTEINLLSELRDSKKRKKIMKKLNPQEIKFLRNVSHNLINNHFVLSPKIKQRLLKYKKPFRYLADKNKKNGKYVKKYLEMSGNGFALLAPLLISLGGQLAGHLMNKVLNKNKAIGV